MKCIEFFCNRQYDYRRIIEEVIRKNTCLYYKAGFQIYMEKERGAAARKVCFTVSLRIPHHKLKWILSVLCARRRL